MTESLVPNEDTKFLRNNHGGLLVLCNDGNHVGMYPASLADILNCSLDKSKFIIDIISDIAENYGFDNVDIATSIIFALSYKIPDPPVGTKNTYLEDYFVLTDAPLINPEDVAEILNVTIEFAKSIYESFYQSINDDESLQAFLQHIEEYLATNHDGVIPKEFQKGSISLSATSSNKSQFSQKEILNILSQQAPAELRPESIIVPIKNEEFSDAVPNIKRENKNNNTYDANNFIESPHFEITCDAIQELLDISPQDTISLMSSPQALAHFLDIDDIDVASAVLGEAANGDMQPLLEIIEAKVDEMVTNIQEENPVAKIDIPEITPQEEMTDTQESLSDSDIKPLFDDNEDNTDTHITQAEQPLTLNEKKPQANTQISIPSNLPDMLRVGFDIKQRITAKSLSESLKIFGADISQSLARYIIEEGGYGGTPPDTHRITSKDMLEKLITDIAKEESLKSFVKIYLAKVNNDLKSMLSGG